MKRIKILIISIVLTLSAYGNIESKMVAIKNDSVVFAYLDSMKYLLDSLGVEEPIYVMAQACWETGWFECKNCSWKYNNMFGFTPKGTHYKKFDTWQESVIYYAEWQKARYPKYKASHPKGTYLGFLTWCKYASGDNYNKRIQWVYNWILENWDE